MAARRSGDRPGRRGGSEDNNASNKALAEQIRKAQEAERAATKANNRSLVARIVRTQRRMRGK